MTKLCSDFKRRFKPQIVQSVAATLSNQHEHGFSVCEGLVTTPTVEGNERMMILPTCKLSRNIGSFHTHRSSPTVEKRIGLGISQRYYSSPSSVDLRPGNQYQFGCVSTARTLTCYKKRKDPFPELDALQVAERTANEEFTKWSTGQITDREFKRKLSKAVAVQEQTMAASGGYCRVKL